MSAMASQITSHTIFYSTIYLGADQRKHQSFASLVFVWEFTGEFPAQMANNAENLSIWWRHHELTRIGSETSRLQGHILLTEIN